MQVRKVFEQYRDRLAPVSSDIDRLPTQVHSHLDVRGGALRATIFGFSDGLVSNVSLVLGTFGAHPGGGVVRIAGLAGLFGGSFSMAAGEYVSMRGQSEVFERELASERRELEVNPEAELAELKGIYVNRGIKPEIAAQLARELMATPHLALATHAREELGIDPNSMGAPIQAALSSFFSFALGAIIPLIPFLTGSASSVTAFIAIGLTAFAALAAGTGLSFFTLRPKIFSALRSFSICAVAGAFTFGIGSLIGVTGH